MLTLLGKMFWTSWKAAAFISNRMLGDAKSLLAAKLRDGMTLSRNRPYFLGFLDEGEIIFCQEFLCRERGIKFLLWGGYEEAERRILGMFPEYMEPVPEAFPLTSLVFTYREEDSLSHRDFLGSFMALGIERNVVGDILPGKGRCVAFVRLEMEAYFLQNIRKIGRTGVQISNCLDGPLPLEREFQELSGVVASQRLDCLVAFLCRISREKAVGLITSGFVARNHSEILSVSERTAEGDVISVRRYGKFIIDRLGPLTSKGRLAVQCRKYK